MKGRWVKEPDYYLSKRTGEVMPCFQPRAKRCRAEKARAEAAIMWLIIALRPGIKGPERARVYKKAWVKGATLTDIAHVVKVSRQAVQQVIRYHDRNAMTK